MFILANSADPDETPNFAASHLGLRCLYMFPFTCIKPVPQMRSLNFRLASPLGKANVMSVNSWRGKFQEVTADR